MVKIYFAQQVGRYCVTLGNAECGHGCVPSLSAVSNQSVRGRYDVSLEVQLIANDSPIRKVGKLHSTNGVSGNKVGFCVAPGIGHLILGGVDQGCDISQR